MKPITFKAKMDIQAAQNDPGPKVIIDPAYSGGILHLSGWSRPVVVDLAGVEIPENLPLARDHSTATGDLLGTLTARSNGRELIAEGRLNSGPAAVELVALHKSGQRFDASIGAEALESTEVDTGVTVSVNGRSLTAPEGGFTLIKKSKLREISLVGVGADSETQVKIAARAAALTGDTLMNETEILNKERTRQREIREVKASYVGKLDADIADQLEASLVDSGATVEAANAEFVHAYGNAIELRQRRASRPTPPVVNANSASNADGGRVLSASILLANGQDRIAEKTYQPHELDIAASMKPSCGMDLATQALRLSGRNVPNDSQSIIRAAFSTNELRQALSDSTGLVLNEAYRIAPHNWRKIAGVKSVQNFHEHKMIRPCLKNGTFKELPETGNISHATAVEETIPYTVKTWAKMFAIDRKTLVNDAINAVLELTQELGRNAARTVNANFWNMLRSADGSFFTSANYKTGATTGLCSDSLSIAVAMLRAMTSSDKEPIDIEIGTLTVPPALEATARSLLSSSELHYDSDAGDGIPTANPWRGLCDLVVEPRLSAAAGGSDAAWYLSATPSTIPAAIVSFLDGLDAPTVEQSETDFNTLGMQFRAYIDAGFDLGDPRGIVKFKGTA